MLPLIVKIVIGLIMSITSFLVVKTLTGNNDRISLYTILIILIVSLPTVILYETRYNAFIVIISYIISIILFKRYFKISLIASVVLCSFSVLLMSMFDVVLSSINLFLFSYNEVRDVWYIVIVNNMLVSILSLVIMRIKQIINKVVYISEKLEDKKEYTIVVFAIISIIIISLLFYNITAIFKLNLYYTITIIASFSISFLYYFYISEKASYEKLNDEYNVLFDYVQNFEEWIDDEQMYRHELNNNLSTIRNMTKNKKIISKIDEMLKFTIIIDDKAIEDLKNIPRGGLKGLLYYKIALAKNKKVKMVIEVSPKIKNSLKQIPERNLRQVCIVLGIYLDNALEAAEESKKKMVTLEIYEVNHMINFVISNSYKNLIFLKDIKKRGFTTKGQSHGNGLYFTRKILNKTEWLDAEQIFLNDFFIQKLTLKKSVE